MRPFLPWPQQLLAPLAVFVALIYGISLDAKAQESYHQFWTSRDIPAFIREVISFPFFADAQEERRGRNGGDRDDDDNKKKNNSKPTSTPAPQRTPIISSVISLNPEPEGPEITPSTTSVPSPTVSIVPVLAVETPTPSPSPEQVALNLDLDSAGDIIRETVQTIGRASPLGGFKLGAFGRPYIYGEGKLDTATTMKLYSLAGVIAMLGITLFNFNSRKS